MEKIIVIGVNPEKQIDAFNVNSRKSAVYLKDFNEADLSYFIYKFLNKRSTLKEVGLTLDEFMAKYEKSINDMWDETSIKKEDTTWKWYSHINPNGIFNNIQRLKLVSNSQMLNNGYKEGITNHMLLSKISNQRVDSIILRDIDFDNDMKEMKKAALDYYDEVATCFPFNRIPSNFDRNQDNNSDWELQNDHPISISSLISKLRMEDKNSFIAKNKIDYEELAMSREAYIKTKSSNLYNSSYIIINGELISKFEIEESDVQGEWIKIVDNTLKTTHNNSLISLFMANKII